MATAGDNTRPAGAQGSDPSSSSSSSMRRRKDTSHLQVLQGESQVFNASKSTDLFGLGVIKLESNIVITDRRVLLLWRRWVCGMCAESLEEAYNLSDLQALNQNRPLALLWFTVGVWFISWGSRMLQTADYRMHDYKRAMALIDTASNGRSRGVQAETDKFASGAYLGLVLFGLVFLLFGIGAFLMFMAKHVHRGVELTLNFSRAQAGVLDWLWPWPWQWWAPKVSSTSRVIKLPKATSQEAYDTLSGLLHDRYYSKHSKPPAHSMAMA